MSKGKEETKQRLLDAVGRVLARQGFEGLGVNAVAREAGVDKVLIYRYFNGLNELLLAFCRQEGFWPSPLEFMGGDRDAFARMSFPEQMSEGAVNYLRALRRRPLARVVLAWRFLVDNELTSAFDSVRQSSFEEVLRLLKTPEGGEKDHQALQAIVGAAVNHLGARSEHLTEFAGLPLDKEEGWERIEAMLRTMITAVWRDA